MLYENILNGVLEKFIITNWIWYDSLIFANLGSFSYLFFPMRIFMLTIFFGKTGKNPYFPTCQVRVIRFYVNYLLLLSSSPLLLLVVLLVVLLVILLVQLRPAIHSVLYRTLTTTIHAQCSLPDLNHDHPRPVFPTGPQPQPSTPNIPCRTSTANIHTQCSLPKLNHDHPRPMFPADSQPRPSTPSIPCRTSTANIHAQCSLPDLM